VRIRAGGKAAGFCEADDGAVGIGPGSHIQWLKVRRQYAETLRKTLAESMDDARDSSSDSALVQASREKEAARRATVLPFGPPPLAQPSGALLSWQAANRSNG
jgi:hypothetical protein